MLVRGKAVVSPRKQAELVVSLKAKGDAVIYFDELYNHVALLTIRAITRCS